MDTNCGGVVASAVLAGWFKKSTEEFTVWKNWSVSVASPAAFQHVTGMVTYRLNIAVK